MNEWRCSWPILIIFMACFHNDNKKNTTSCGTVSLNASLNATQWISIKFGTEDYHKNLTVVHFCPIQIVIYIRLKLYFIFFRGSLLGSKAAGA
jgi:hypothetical protein